MGERVPNVISKLPGHTGPTIRVGLDTAKQLLRPRRMQVTSNGRSRSITACGSAALSLRTVVTALVIAPDQSTIIVGATFWYSSGGATFITRLRPTTERNLCAHLGRASSPHNIFVVVLPIKRSFPSIRSALPINRSVLPG
jgi:hypothetical protein